MNDNLPPITRFDQVTALACLLFWLASYVLIIKRGFQDKTFGMPMLVLCANVGWEALLEFVFPVPYPSFHVGYMVWWSADLIILYTCLRWGRDDFEHPFIRKWFYAIIPVSIALSALVEWAFMKTYQDVYGTILGWILNLVIGGSLITMLLRRRSVRGQSVYIGLGILLGNVAGYIQCLTYPMPPPHAPLLLVHVLAPPTLLLNVIYVIMVWQQCRLDGLSPLKRF